MYSCKLSDYKNPILDDVVKNLIVQGQSAINVIDRDDNLGIASKIAVLILAHLNRDEPRICQKTSSGFWLNNLNGVKLLFGDDIYEIRMTEGVVGYPERMAQMCTAVLIPRQWGCDYNGNIL